MSEFPEVTSVASKAVTQVSSELLNETTAPARRPRRAGRSSQVTVTRVRLDVWRKALELASDDRTRLVVESPQSVLIVNHGRGQ